ncbi:hypothetical protein MTR_6g084530 [Medicago truncatula]|uniref:Uncharacterized protein n=1 Tax=Medicago truncatula TaxID=3880 RepID=A0A072UB67_MEDTR|nr:hypothetical protein MTR_6g084530 [Medicago truncatula]
MLFGDLLHGGGVNTRSDSNCKFGAIRFKHGGARRQHGGSVAVDKKFGWGLLGSVHVQTRKNESHENLLFLMTACC